MAGQDGRPDNLSQQRIEGNAVLLADQGNVPAFGQPRLKPLCQRDASEATAQDD